MAREDKIRKAPTPRDFDSLPPGADKKSSFSDGDVHKIIFKSKGGQKQLYRVIYRKLNQEEYNNLVNNYKIVASVYPSVKNEHFDDVYYIKKDSKKSYAYLSLDNIEELKENFPDQEVELELVPLKDIYEKGIDSYPITYDNLYDKYDAVRIAREKISKDVEKKAEKDKKDQEKLKALGAEKEAPPEEESQEYKDARQKAITFKNLPTIDNALSRMVGYYNNSISGSNRKDASEKLSKLINAVANEIDQKIRNPLITKALLDLLEREYTFINKKGLFDKIKKRVTGEEDKTQSYTPTSAKKEPIGKEPTIKEPESKKVNFLANDQYRGQLNKLLQAYSIYTDPKVEKVEKDYQKNQFLDSKIDLIDSIFKFTKKEKIADPDKILSTEIKDYLKDFIKDEEIYNILLDNITNTYNRMKSKELKETAITEAEGPSKKYAIELKPDSDAEKLYISKSIPKVFGRKNTYIRSLSPDQVKSLNRSVDVVSVEEMPKDAKGFLKPSASFRDKEKGAVRFDPKNPKDIENLTGKLKPGDKLYSVSIKIGDAKSQDLMMPLSQIEKLVPDLKFGKNIQQPFEKEMFRTISKDTGEKIYDKVKGVLSFNSTEPIGKTDDKKTSEKPTSDLPPAAKYSQKAGSEGNLTLKYYLVDVSDTENYPNGKMVRNNAGGYVGFNDRDEAKAAAADMGPDVKVYQKAEVASKRVSFDDSPVAKKPEKAQYNYYLVSNGKVLKDKDGKYAGANSKEEAEKLKFDLQFDEKDLKGDFYDLKDMKDIKIVDKEQLKAMLVKKQTPGVPSSKFSDYAKSWGRELKEALSKEDIAKLKSTRVSFTIQSDLDPDKQYNISDNVREVKEEKGKVVLILAEAGIVTFDKEGTGIFKYSKDNKEYQALNVPADINSIVKKALTPEKDDKAAEPKLEAYIRKRIRQAIKEAEVSQYWGYQGKDVKKKRLEEYLKRYDWGFQDSDNPYIHSNGSAKHAIVSKLVHELESMGVDAIAIFNSYAPKEYQVSDINQLDYASDSPLGSQLTQPYNPDSLTARGGRVAEEDGKVTSIAQQYLDKVNAKYKKIEDLAKGYNSKDRDIMGSDSVKNVVQKAIAAAYGKDAAKAGPELKKAFMSISDEDLKK